MHIKAHGKSNPRIRHTAARTTTWIIILLLKAKMRLTHPPRSTWIISLTRAFQPAILICLSVEARRLHLPWLPPKWRRRCMYPLPPPNSFYLPTTLWEGQQRTVDACPRWVQWHTGSLPECWSLGFMVIPWKKYVPPTVQGRRRGGPVSIFLMENILSMERQRFSGYPSEIPHTACISPSRLG